MSIICLNVALSETPQTESGRRMALLYHLAPKLQDWFTHSGLPEDLKTFVSARREVIRISPMIPDLDQKLLCNYLIDLAVALALQYDERNQPQDLDEALKSAQKAKSVAETDFETLETLNVLPQIYARYFDKTGDKSDIDMAIKHTKDALDNIDKSKHLSSLRVELMGNLSNFLVKRFEFFCDPDNIKEAVECARAAVESQGDSPQGQHLESLARALSFLYDVTGDINNINEAVELVRRSTKLTNEHEDHDTAEALVSLAALLALRFHCDAEMADLEEAIQHAEAAAGLCPEGSSTWRAAEKVRLGCLISMIKWKGDGYSEAATAIGSVLNRTPKGDPLRVFGHIHLSEALQGRYEHTDDVSFLIKAVEAAETAVSETEGGPNHNAALHTLGSRLISRHETDPKETVDLKRAIETLEAAVTQKDHRHAGLSQYRRSLAVAYRTLRTPESNSQAYDLFTKVHGDSNAFPLARIGSAREAIAIAVKGEEWDDAAKLAADALELVPMACRRHMSRGDQQHAVKEIFGLAAEAASLSLRAGDAEKALQQLENGRVLILGYAMDNGADMSSLRKVDEKLASRFAGLMYKANADELEEYRTGESSLSQYTGQVGQLVKEWRASIAQQRSDERRNALQDIEACVADIRAVPGFETFWTAPKTAELQKQASAGPIVVVNMSRIRFDAILITTDTIKAFHLSGISLKQLPMEVSERLGASAAVRRWNAPARYRDGDFESDDDESDDEIHVPIDLYSWLWTAIVKPVLDELDAIGSLRLDGRSSAGRLPRVWWIGSGLASGLPFHAAGVDFADDATENTLARIVPSYVPTIKALASSREKESTLRVGRTAPGPGGGQDKKKSLLLVTMPTTPGQVELPGIEAERAAIVEACGDVCHVDEAQHHTAKAVLEKLAELSPSIVHFACHGHADPADPFQSCLLLYKPGDADADADDDNRRKPSVDRLTALAISQNAPEEGPAWVAFLSACDTARTKTLRLADEGLHLVSAFQLAGFAHSVGTLWRAEDATCARLSHGFYTELLRQPSTTEGVGDATAAHGGVAEALRLA
ncbi:hypothetical protein Sste5344_000956, partial [Sporothrix stenoceras]